MKKLLFLLVMLFSITSMTTYASFPVNSPSENMNNEQVVTISVDDPIVPNSTASDSGWQGIVSLSCAVLGLLVAGLPLGICAVVFGAMGLNKKLKGLAIAGMVVGILEVIIMIAYLSS